MDISPEKLLESIGISAHEDLNCPLTKCIFHVPAVAADGFTYERSAIKKWMRKKFTSPLTREHMDTKLYKNLVVKKQCIEFKGLLLNKGIKFAKELEEKKQYHEALNLFKFIYSSTQDITIINNIINLYNLTNIHNVKQSLKTFAIQLSLENKVEESQKIYKKIDPELSYVVTLFPCLHRFVFSFLEEYWNDSQDYSMVEECPYCHAEVTLPRVYMGGSCAVKRPKFSTAPTPATIYEDPPWSYYYRYGAYMFMGSFFEGPSQNAITEYRTRVDQITCADIFVFCLSAKNVDKFLNEFYIAISTKYVKIYITKDNTVKEIPASVRGAISYLYNMYESAPEDFLIGIEALQKYKNVEDYWDDIKSWFSKKEWKHIEEGEVQQKRRKISTLH